MTGDRTAQMEAFVDEVVRYKSEDKHINHHRRRPGYRTLLAAAFDAGFISLAGDGVILISPLLSSLDRVTLSMTEPLHPSAISLGRQQRLAGHRENLFVKQSA